MNYWGAPRLLLFSKNASGQSTEVFDFSLYKSMQIILCEVGRGYFGCLSAASSQNIAKQAIVVFSVEF